MSRKRRLYQHWPGSFIQECITMVIPTRNGNFLNEILKKRTSKTHPDVTLSDDGRINDLGAQKVTIVKGGI